MGVLWALDVERIVGNSEGSIELDLTGIIRRAFAILSRVRPAPILLGTSSFTAAGWLGSFYPKGTRSADFLTFYADYLVCEIMWSDRAAEIPNAFGI